MHNMDARKMIARAMEYQVRMTREALQTNVYLASIHHDNVKTLSETLHLLTNFEANLLAQLDVD